jgi:hypothetical protein
VRHLEVYDWPVMFCCWLFLYFIDWGSNNKVRLYVVTCFQSMICSGKDSMYDKSSFALTPSSDGSDCAEIVADIWLSFLGINGQAGMPRPLNWSSGRQRTS